MSWKSFLEALCRHREYSLTLLETEVVMCLQEEPGQTKNELLEAYIRTYSAVEEDAFTQRLKNIYRKFKIEGKGYKLPQLNRYLVERYLEYQRNDVFFSEIGLNHIHPSFPRDAFGQAIDDLTNSDSLECRQVDILQTFAPNLEDYFDHLVRCVQNNVQVRILLAWPYSEAAKLRGEVLKRYAKNSMGSESDIQSWVIANLETLEKIIRISGNSKLLEIKLYDTLPSLAIYRAGDYMLAAPFLHGSLAVDTFQLALSVSANNQLVSQTLKRDFELMWQVARRFYPDPSRSWRNDLKILFMNEP